MGSRPSRSVPENHANARNFDSSLSSMNSLERSQTPMIVIDSADGKSPKKKHKQKENAHNNNNENKINRAKSSSSTGSSVSSLLAMPMCDNTVTERFQAGYPTILGRCYNCGESGHFTADCRHNKPVVCKTCGLKGHKKDYCKTYSRVR